MNKTAKTVLIVILAILVIAAIGIQFVPVERTNPPVTAPLTADAPVFATLLQSCYDCHSNETIWPWYSYVAPVSWLVAADVAEGREHLNFSEWGNLTAAQQEHAGEEIIDEIEEGKMPLPKYVKIHPAARLDKTDRQLITQWVHGLKHIDWTPDPRDEAGDDEAGDDSTAREGGAGHDDTASAEEHDDD